MHYHLLLVREERKNTSIRSSSKDNHDVFLKLWIKTKKQSDWVASPFDCLWLFHADATSIEALKMKATKCRKKPDAII